jgi:hypothetical protein
MQIHEITARKKLQEVSMLGSLASAMANKFVSSTLGIDPNQGSGGGASGAKDDRARGATEINKQAAGLLGQQMGRAWAVAVQEFMKNHKDSAGNPLMNMSNANPGDAARLRQELNNMVVGATKIGKPLDQWVASINTGDVSDRQEAKIIADTLTRLQDAIWKETVEPSDTRGQARTQAFNNLGVAIAQAQNVNTFTRPDTDSAYKVKIDPATGRITVNDRPYDPGDPAQKAAVEAYMAARGGSA